MNVFLNRNLTPLKSIPSAVHVNSEYANVINVFAPFAPTVPLKIAVMNALGKVDIIRNMTAVGQISGVEHDGSTFSAWTFALNSLAAASSGRLTFQIYAYFPTRIVTSTQFVVNVLPGVPKVLPDAPTESVYDEIYQAFSAIVEKVYDTVGTPNLVFDCDQSGYQFDVSNLTCSVVGYTGNQQAQNAVTTLKIPPYHQYVRTYINDDDEEVSETYFLSVVGVSCYFPEFANLEKISLPETLTSIGDTENTPNCFARSKVFSINIPESVISLNGQCLPTANSIIFEGHCPTVSGRPIDSTITAINCTIVCRSDFVEDFEEAFGYVHTGTNNYSLKVTFFPIFYNGKYVVDDLKVEKDIYVSGVHASGDVFADNITANGSILSENDIDANGDISSGGNMSVGQDLTVERDATVKRNLTVDGIDAGSIESEGDIKSTAGEIVAKYDIESTNGDIVARSGYVGADGDVISENGNVEARKGCGYFNSLEVAKQQGQGGDASVDGDLTVGEDVDIGGDLTVTGAFSKKYGASLSLTVNSSTFVLTAQLKDQDGNNLGSAQTVDLPLESVVVGGSYDDTTKKVVLTLQSGSTIEFSVADLIDGLQSEITAQNPLSADLVDDTNTTNKFVTAADKAAWNAKQDALTFDNVPTENSANPVKSGGVYNAVKALKDDVESGEVKAGIAKQIENVSEESGTTQTAPFLFQGTGTNNNTTETPTAPIAKQLELRGNSVVVNQLIQNGDFADASVIVPYSNKISVSVSNSVMTYTLNEITGTVFDENYRVSLNNNSISIISGHKYLIIAEINTPHSFAFSIGGGASSYVEEYNTWIHFKSIVTSTQNIPNAIANQFFPIGLTSTNGWEVNDGIQFKNYALIDLTKWFGGNDNIPTDILNNPYKFLNYYQGSLAYNAGTLASANATALKTVGFNQFDYANSTEYIHVVPNQDYAIENASGGAISEYSADETLIKTTNVNDLSLTDDTNALPHIIIGKDTAFVKITGYTASTCFYLYWDGQRTGYEEYVSHSYALGNDVLRSARNAYDSKASDGTITRRIGVVDLGSLNWNYVNWGVSGHLYRAELPVPYKDNLTADSGIANMICSKYLTTSYGDIYSGEYIGISAGPVFLHTGDYVYIRDTNYTEDSAGADALENDLNGVMLYYESASTITEAGTAFAESIDVDDYGTMEFNCTNGVPQGNKFFYPADYVLLMDDLNNYTDGDVNALAKKSELAAGLATKQDKPSTVTDLSSSTVTVNVNANTRYNYSTLSSLNITFPSTANDGDEIVINFVSGSTATTLTRDTTNAIYNFSSISSGVFVELNAEFKASIGKWVVISAETEYSV